MGIDVPEDPDVAAGISLTYAEYLEAVVRLREVDFPIERDPAEAWPHFVGWRVNASEPPMRSPPPWTWCLPCGPVPTARDGAHPAPAPDARGARAGVSRLVLWGKPQGRWL